MKISYFFQPLGGLLLLVLATTLRAQVPYQVADNSTMVIRGTSTLHDWESEVTQLQGEAKVTTQEQPPVIQDFTLTIPVKSIKSGKKAMDKNTFEALREEEHPNVQLRLRDIRPTGADQLRATGDLTVAGQTQPVTVQASYTADANQITVQGSHTMKMTDFGIDPPTALLGTIKTGDKITVDYTLHLQKIN